MKKLFLITVILFIILFGIYIFNFTSENKYIKNDGIIKQIDKSEIDKSKVVYTSFYPIYFLVNSFIGKNEKVINLLPTGGEPHEYEPTLKQIGDIKKSDLIVLNGLGIENYKEKFLKNTGTGKIILLSEKYSEKKGYLDNNLDIDSHTWLSPKVYLEMANILAVELEKRGFKINKTVITDLENLHKNYTSNLKNCYKKEIITSHEAFGYLALDYGFREKAVMGMSPEQEPLAKNIAKIIDVINKEKLKYIFSEEFISEKFALIIKKETGVQVLKLHTLETLSTEEEIAKEDYISIMKRNLENLKIGLECN